LENRCGITDTENFFHDQKYLYLDNIYLSNQLVQETVTIFAVKRNTFKSFFFGFETDKNRDTIRQYIQNFQSSVLQRITAATAENGIDIELSLAEDNTVEDNTAINNKMAIEFFSAEYYTAIGNNSDIIWQSPEVCR